MKVKTYIKLKKKKLKISHLIICHIKLKYWVVQQSPQENFKFNFEYKEPISMCNQQGHVKSDKVNNIVVNGIDREEVMIIENCFEKAKLNVSKNGKTNDVYEKIPYNNQKSIQVKWVLTMKETNDQQIPKARLVIKGFGEQQKIKY